MLLGLLVACGEPARIASAEAAGDDPEPSGIVLQAVDAGTGSALADSFMTVRHLVRSPITLDASAAVRTPTAAQHRIEHPVAADSLVLEVRVEAASYHRLDTVFAVARGTSVGPLTLRMARRLDRIGSEATSESRPGAAAGAESEVPASPADPVTPETSVTSQAPDSEREAGEGAQDGEGTQPDRGVEIDRAPLLEGDRAFRNGEWAAATDAYRRMPRPVTGTDVYAREYVQALVRLGASHIELGEGGGALDALEEARELEAPGHEAHLLLGEAECAVGRIARGRATLGEIERMAASIAEGDRPGALALAKYQGAVCTQAEFGRAREPRELMQTGTRAIRELQSFIDRGEALSPQPAAVGAAVEDARRRIAVILERLGTGGA